MVHNLPSVVPLQPTAIDLTRRHLTRMDSDSFSNHSDVILLLISHNEIVTVGSATFVGLDNLNTLDLSFNQIATIADDAFSDLYSLKRVLLNTNKITYVSSKWFLGLDNIQVLYLGGNVIHSVQTDAFAVIRNLKVLSLSNASLTQSPDIPKGLLMLDLSSNYKTTNNSMNLRTNFTHISLSGNLISSSSMLRMIIGGDVTMVRLGNKTNR